ncbi:MAG: exonuclease SbcCD subunit D [Candidatus Methanofastidiosia archaeon]
MFIHSADSHLGIQRYTKVNPKTGLNVRMMDFCNAFLELIEFTLEERCDFLLFCGDLFDSVNPTNYVRKFVQNQLFRLSERKINTFIIPGNHDTPRTKGVRNPLTLYSNIPHIFCGLKPFEKKIGMYRICGIPYTENPIKHVKKPLKGCFNILMLHTMIEGSTLGSERFMSFLESSIEPQRIPNYDYVALGHVHKHQVMRNKAYPGSLERYDFNEISERKGFISYDEEIEFVEVKTRVMEDHELLCDGLDGFEITRKALGCLKDVDDKILRLTLKGEILKAKKKTLNYEMIRRSARNALSFTFRDQTFSKEIFEIKEGEILYPPEKELSRYLKASGEIKAFRTGLEIIKEVME